MTKLFNLRHLKSRIAPAFVLASAAILGACADSNEENRTILEIAVDNPNTSILEAAVLAADPSIAALLGGSDPLTVFAPTDAAFQDLLTALGVDAATLLADTALLNAVLPYHVLATAVGEVRSPDAISVAQTPVPGNLVPTVNSENVALSLSNESGNDVLYVNTSRVTAPDVIAANGVIHLIDKVLLPPPSAKSDRTKTIATLVTELTAANPAEFTVLLAALQATPSLLAAAADANSTLTVFAPTDAAFNALLADLGITAGDLLANPNLPTILSQHILDAEVGSLTAYASNGGMVETLAANFLNVDIANNALVIEGATVVEADIQASNGVIHVIDTVIATVD
jgi:uncharacterized surface protein with fasciclin (FAS1) repeats